MRKFSIKFKFVVLLAAIIVACLCVNLAWLSYNGGKQTERELLQQARALSANMDAVWDFMIINQDLINYDSEGRYEFKGLQCSIAGRSIGSLFSKTTDYETRYVSATPRNDSDLPDAFEAQALAIFEGEPELEEYYAVDEVAEGQAFRYLAPMRIEESCLSCHGEPAGEIDESGYEKEGLKIGDLYGAVSLQIPMGAYEDASRENATQSALFALLLIAACLAVVYVALSVLVTRPFGRLRHAIGNVEAGDLSVRLDPETSSLEADELAHGFNQMTERIEELRDGLEGQVAERTRQLERVNESLEDANARLREENRFKGDFLAMMSHELRTPLAASMSFTDLLKERRAPENDEEARLWSEVEANNKTLLSLINNILAMARIDAGKEELHLELVDVGDVVGMLQATAEPLARQKGLVMEYRIGEDVPLFMADAEKVRRVVENLVSNAVKFTPEGGLISISIRHDESRRRIVFAVSDSGIGIPQEDQAAVFERFVQVDSSSSRSYGGSGLGLALVKELVEMHGGSVSLESVPGRGSTFTVEIPSDLSDGGVSDGRFESDEGR